MKTVYRREIVRRAARICRQKPTAVNVVLQHLLDQIVDELAAGNRVQLSGFGTFTPNVKKARVYRHPTTGKPCTIPTYRYLRFRAGAEARRSVNERVRSSIPSAHDDRPVGSVGSHA